MKNKYAGGWMVLALCFSLVLTATSGSVIAANSAGISTQPDRISPQLQRELQTLAPDGRISVIVSLTSQENPLALSPNLESIPAERRPAEVEARLEARAGRDQAGLRGRLAQLESRGQVEKVVPLWIIDGISLTAPAGVIAELAARPDVAQIEPDAEFQIQPDRGATPTLGLPAANSNISLLNVPAVWALGFRGQGVVVANLDTGVDATHPDLASRYRGGNDSWYDPYGQHTGPTDMAGTSTGHGTATMSLMVGGSASGSDIGVAPGAKWIAAKVFDDSGNASATAIHLAFQWVLNPNHSATNPGAPRVVNSSWGTVSGGCDLTLQPDVQALLAAGILPVFSAGNSGPNSSTDSSPANYPESFSVGAINNASTVATFSSRGPTTCGRPQPMLFPLVVAPGVNISVAAPGGAYAVYSGTSFSAPETAGVIALLLSAFPNLTPANQARAITSSAVDLGPIIGPDNDYGYGRVDALAAYKSLASPVPPNPSGTPAPQKFFLPLIHH